MNSKADDNTITSGLLTKKEYGKNTRAHTISLIPLFLFLSKNAIIPIIDKHIISFIINILPPYFILIMLICNSRLKANGTEYWENY